MVSLGSSPAQQSIAQPRQVRKEATVGNQFCVTQGNLTSFFCWISKPYSHHRRLVPQKRTENGKDHMVHFLKNIIIQAISLMLPGEHYSEFGRTLRFSRFGGGLTQVFPRLEWYQYSGGTFPLRFETRQVHNINLLLQWKRILHEKRYYHQFNCERTSHCYS